jgi:hypothetical protein
VSVTYDLLTRASAKADTFASLGVLANTGSQESDLAYSQIDSNYYLFSTYEVSDGVSTIGATQVFTASTPTGLFSASPTAPSRSPPPPLSRSPPCTSRRSRATPATLTTARSSVT